MILEIRNSPSPNTTPIGEKYEVVFESFKSKI